MNINLMKFQFNKNEILKTKRGKIMLKYVVVVLLVSLLLFGCVNSQPNAPSSGGQTTVNKSNQTMVTENRTGFDQTQQAIKMAIADGNYEQNVTYSSPAGDDIVDISISVLNNTITSVSLKPTHAAPISENFIKNYNQSIQSLVVGKKIDQINLPHNVAGSSLTNAAFKQYLSQLESS